MLNSRDILVRGNILFHRLRLVFTKTHGSLNLLILIKFEFLKNEYYFLEMDEEDKKLRDFCNVLDCWGSSGELMKNTWQIRFEVPITLIEFFINKTVILGIPVVVQLHCK